MIDQGLKLYDLHKIQNNDYKDGNRTKKHDPFHISFSEPSCEMHNQDSNRYSVYDVENYLLSPQQE